MKNKTILIVLTCVLLVSFLLGATGTVAFVKDETAGSLEKDRLIGVFITTEYLDLFDYESYLEENADKMFADEEVPLSGGDFYQDRLYAALVDDLYTNSETGETVVTKKYVFEGIDGICYFAAKYTDEKGSYWSASGDDAISDGHTAFKSMDAGESIDLKGTIYVSSSKGYSVFYFNPVYQTSTGEVYVISGDGVSYGGSIVGGMSGSHVLKDEQTVNVDGRTEIMSSNIDLSIYHMDRPTSMKILQFDKAGSVIDTQKYVSGNLPSKIETKPDVDYIIVETYMKSMDGMESVARELFEREDESLFSFSCRKDGICVKQYSSIIWGE